MADNDILINVGANTSSAEAAMTAFGEKASSVGKKLGLALGGYLTFSAIKNQLEKSVEAAMESDKAVKALNISLAQTGQYTKAASESFQNYASDLQKSTGISDEVIMKGASSLVTLGKVSTDSLNKVTKASLDLAAGMGIDAASAFDVMSRAANGNTKALAQYGIKTKEGADESQKFALALAQIQQRFGGMAEANMDPFKKLTVSIDEAYESIGKFFTQSKTFKAVMIVIAGEIDKFSETLNKIGKSGDDPIGTLIAQFFDLGAVINKFLIMPIEFALNILKTGFLGIFTGIAAAAELVAVALNLDIKQSLKDLRENLADQLVETADKGFETPVADAIENKIVELKQKRMDTAASMKDEIVNSSEQASAQSLSNWEAFANGFTTITGTMLDRIKQLGSAMRSTFVSGFSNAFGAMGKALISGGNLMEAFGKAMLNTLGQLAMQLSQFFILEGIGMMFGGSAAAGAGLIAAGAAIGVLGGVLMALGGGGGGGATGASAPGGAGDFSSNASFGGNQLSEQERITPQTGVNVVVNGNIFDNKESALQIAQLLNDSFDLSGTLVRANA